MFRQAFALIASLLLLSGCVRSIQPVLTDEQVTLDPAFAGKWVSQDGKVSFEATADNDSKKYDVVYRDEDGKLGKFVVRLGKVQELMIAEVSPGELPNDSSDIYRAHLLPLYSFLMVQRTDNGMRVSTMSAEWVSSYLEKHPEELQVISRKKEDLVVTSPTVDLQKFILKHYKDEDAMTKPTLFVRPGEPSTRPAK